jgi:ribosomal protein S14
MIAIAAQ